MVQVQITLQFFFLFFFAFFTSLSVFASFFLSLIVRDFRFSGALLCFSPLCMSLTILVHTGALYSVHIEMWKCKRLRREENRGTKGRKP